MIKNQQDTLYLFYNENIFQHNYQSIDSIFIKKADSLKVRNFYFFKSDKNLLLDNKTISYRESLFKQHNTKKKSLEIPIHKKSLDPFFTVFIALFLILSWLFFNYRKNIRQIINAGFNNQKMQHLVREHNLFKERISIFFYLNFVVSFSFFIIQAYSYFLIPSKIENLFTISLNLSLIILLFIILKWLIMYFIGIVFKNEEAAFLYILNSLIYNVITSFILIPFTFIIFYIGYDLREYFLYLGIIILIIINLFRYFRYIIIGITYSKFSYFYLILYLCALEILPLLLVLKIFSKLVVNNIEFL